MTVTLTHVNLVLNLKNINFKNKTLECLHEKQNIFTSLSEYTIQSPVKFHKCNWSHEKFISAYLFFLPLTWFRYMKNAFLNK